MKRWVPLAILVLPLSLLYWLSGRPGPVPKPLAPPAPLARVEPEPSAVADAGTTADAPTHEPPGPAQPASPWPLRAHAVIPAERTLPLPEGTVVLDTALAADGGSLLVVLSSKTAAAEPRLARWLYADTLIPVALQRRGRVLEVAASAYDDTVYLLVKDGAEHQVLRARSTPDALVNETVIYRAPERLSSLVCPFVLWDGEERCFFARALAGDPRRTQIIGLRRSGALAYEVTSPSGALGKRTVPELRAREVPEQPAVARFASARPISLDPDLGTLLLADGGGALYELPYDAQNWSPPKRLSAKPGTIGAHTPNAWLQLRWRAGERGVELVDPEGRRPVTVAPERRFTRLPEVAPTERTVVGVVDEGAHESLRTFTVTHPLAAVRYLGHVAPPTVARLAAKGIEVRNTGLSQLYAQYERLLYDPPRPVPVFASIDGMIEVLNAGFQAVFMLAERDVSRPKLTAFAEALRVAAERRSLPRIAAIASTTLRMLQGDYAHDEGRRVLAEETATSALHVVPEAAPIDFATFHPRGSYTATPALSDYFRAFSYLNLLALTAEERAALAAEPEVRAAHAAWVAVQDPFVWPARQASTLFGETVELPNYVRPDCIPERVRRLAPRPYPLGFGPDGEILESTVSRLGVASDCTTRNEEPYRKLPDGRDLLIGLGSREAVILAEPEYDQHPELRLVHARLAERFLGALDGPEDARDARGHFARHWLRLIQLLGNDEAAPEGVDLHAWRARLLETALATWVGYRHTTVLVTEASGAEAGAGWVGFEYLDVEPVRGVVDPVPAAWDLLGRMLEELGARAHDDGIQRQLAESTADVRGLASMARRQHAGAPLTEKEYDALAVYARTLEHAYLKLQSSLTPSEAIQAPDPMMKLADIQTWTDARSGEHLVWHAAVGRPRAVVVLLPDRGMLVPGHGALYAYHEVVADRPLDDAAWRAEVDRAVRPAWLDGLDVVTSTRAPSW